LTGVGGFQLLRKIDELGNRFRFKTSVLSLLFFNKQSSGAEFALATSESAILNNDENC
jgi:hypothetical protein